LGAVKENLIPLRRVVDAMSAKPASIFGLDHKGEGKGRIAEGYDADIVLVNTRNVQVIIADKLHSRAGWTPFEGRNGIFPEMVLSRGEVVYDGEIVCKRGRGQFLHGTGWGGWGGSELD